MKEEMKCHAYKCLEERIELLEEQMRKNENFNSHIELELERCLNYIEIINKQKFSEFHHLQPDIEKLKNEIKSLKERLDRIDHKFVSALNEHEERIGKLEYNEFSDTNKSEWQIEIENKLSIQMEIFKTNFASIKSIQSKKPHKCPVCDGSTMIMVSDCLINPFNEACKACEGKGILWG